MEYAEIPLATWVRVQNMNRRICHRASRVISHLVGRESRVASCPVHVQKLISLFATANSISARAAQPASAYQEKIRDSWARRYIFRGSLYSSTQRLYLEDEFLKIYGFRLMWSVCAKATVQPIGSSFEILSRSVIGAHRSTIGMSMDCFGEFKGCRQV